MDTEMREGKVAPPSRAIYRFKRLKKRGQSLFFAGADSHRVRQAATSFEDNHPDLGLAGDRFRISKEKEGDVPGIGVYRVAINE